MSHQSPGEAHVTAGRLFLDLLLRDAPPVEYDRPVLEARTTGADDQTLTALEETKTAALQVRAVLHDYRRRESELAALYETAHDLAGMRNLDQVLRAIVDRARTLLSTDVAYLTLRDSDSGDTSMRVTSGSVSARFQQVRLGPGEGLGGLVATTALPYVTANYLTDDRFVHTDRIDAAVREEGLEAILGVPLELNGQVIGVLFAANRRERPFARAEIALLRSLATHAAIAIDTANLIDRSRTALAELSTANKELQSRTKEMERASDAHDRLTDLLLRGADTDDITEAVALLLDGAVRLLHLADDQADGDPSLAEAIAESLARGRVASRDGQWVAAAAAAGEPLGALVLTRSIDLDAVEQRILERAAVVTALLLLLRRSASDAEHRVRGELLEEVLTRSGRDPESLRERARRVATDPARPHALVVVDAPGADQPRLRAAARHVAEVRRGLTGTRDGRVVLAVPGETPPDVVAWVAAELRTATGSRITAAAAGPTGGLTSFPAVYQQARQCLQAMLALGRDGETAVPQQLGFLGVLLGHDRDVGGFVRGALGPLLEYDAARGSALIETLAAYFDAGGSMRRAKDALHVHVNTVAQRLERIAQLIGPDWHEPGRALELQLALRLHRLQRHGVDDLGGS